MWVELEDGALVLTEDSHERYVHIREAAPDDGRLAAMASVRVGLFKNQALVAWAEPCETPDSYQGFEGFDFYRLPALRLPVSLRDTLQVAAVVTDIYGRVTVSQDASYILDEDENSLTWPDNSVTDPDPGHWRYD